MTHELDPPAWAIALRMVLHWLLLVLTELGPTEAARVSLRHNRKQSS